MAQTLPSSLSNETRLRFSSYSDMKIRNAEKLLRDRCHLPKFSELIGLYVEHSVPGKIFKNEFVVAVASKGGRYVGIVVMEQFHKTKRKIQYNGNIFVKPSLRRKGVGTKLLLRAEKVILSLGYQNVEVDANDDFSSFARDTFRTLPVR